MAERKIFAGGEFLITDVKAEDVFAPEEFTKEHQMIYDAAMDFVKKEIAPNSEKVENKDEEFIRNLLKTAGELGLNSTDIPVEYDGEGMDKISTCLVTEAMGGAGSFAVSHAAHTGIGTLPIVYFGNEDQKKKYLPKLASGEWFSAYCLTEPNAGSDALGAQTTATLSEDGKHYLLNGEKIYITNGAWASVYMVYAKVDGEKFTGFIVDRDAPGLSIGPEEKKMGIQGSSTTPVIFKDCQVPVENVLFEVGQGHKIAFNTLNIGRYKLGASTAGGCKLSVAEAAKYATSREQFGKKICNFGMIQSKLADMSIRGYMSESMAYRVAAAIDDKLNTLDDAAKNLGEENAKAIEEYAVECSIVKVYGSEALDFCVDELVQIHGGNGYISEYPAERMYRDSRINRIFEGTNEINRLLIPGTLVKRATQGRLPLMEVLKDLKDDIKDFSKTAPEKLKADTSPLAMQTYLLQAAKNIALMAAGAAVNKLMFKLADEQEVMGLLADMVIEIYAMESGLLRAKKVLEKKGEKKAEYHMAAVKVYINDTLPRIVHWARQVVAFVEEEGDELGAQIYVLGKLGAFQPVDTIGLRRLIAEKVIKGKKYPF